MKLNYYKFIHFISGFLIIIPLYFKFGSFYPELINISPLLFIPGEKLIPIGFYSLIIFILLNIKKINKSFFVNLIIADSLLFFLLYKIPFPRFIALLIPINFIYFVSLLIRKKYYLDSFCNGYFSGVIVTYLINIISAIKNYPYTGNILGFEIYSFYVSYSAVSSTICGMTLLIIICFKKLEKKLFFILSLLLSISFFVSLLPQRRSALVDLGFCFILIIFFQFLRSRNKQLSLRSFIFIPISLLLIKISINNVYSPISTLTQGRSIAYTKALKFLNSDDISGFFFGYIEGFADYSNLFLELFVRAGILGLIAYITILIYSIRFYLNSLTLEQERKLPLEHKIPLFFILFSVLLGNIANINLSLPYYSINLVMILLSFRFLLNRVIENNDNTKIYKKVNLIST